MFRRFFPGLTAALLTGITGSAQPAADAGISLLNVPSYTFVLNPAMAALPAGKNCFGIAGMADRGSRDNAGLIYANAFSRRLNVAAGGWGLFEKNRTSGSLHIAAHTFFLSAVHAGAGISCSSAGRLGAGLALGHRASPGHAGYFIVFSPTPEHRVQAAMQILRLARQSGFTLFGQSRFVPGKILDLQLLPGLWLKNWLFSLGYDHRVTNGHGITGRIRKTFRLHQASVSGGFDGNFKFELGYRNNFSP